MTRVREPDETVLGKAWSDLSQVGKRKVSDRSFPETGEQVSTLVQCSGVCSRERERVRE